MVLSIPDLFIIVLFIISGSITFVVFSNFIFKKSFHQIHDKLLKSDQTDEKKILIIKNLHEFVTEYSDEQILIFNFRFSCLKSNHWYSLIFISIILIYILVMIRFELSPYIGTSIIFLICIGYLFLIAFIWWRSDRVSIRNIVNVFPLIFFRTAGVLTSIIFCILLLLMILIQFTEPKSIISFIDMSTPYINYGLESISNNQLSLAGLFFTFAIGGTIIFTVTNEYLKQKKEIRKMLLEDIIKFEIWFVINECNISFDFHDITKTNSDKIKGYSQALSNLRSELNSNRFYELILPMRRYKLLRSSIFMMYLMGILTLILTQSVINLLFYIFIILSFLFMGLIYINFKDYS